MFGMRPTTRGMALMAWQGGGLWLNGVLLEVGVDVTISRDRDDPKDDAQRLRF